MHSCIGLQSTFVAICKPYLLVLITAYFSAFPSVHLYSQPSWSASLLLRRHAIEFALYKTSYTYVKVVGYLFGVYIVYVCLPVHVHEDVCTVYMYLYCAGTHLELTTECSLGHTLSQQET